MSDPAFSGIPEALATAVRAVDVPHDLRTLFERLAVPLAVEIEAPVEDAPPLALQLLRLAGHGSSLRLVGARTTSSGPRVRFIHGMKDLVLGAGELADGIPALGRRIAQRLLDADEAAGALERFARESPRQEALRRLTRAMLETGSIDRLRTILLIGMTSGLALGFSRAALFVYDEDGRALVGESAIGPADAAEAARARATEWPGLEPRIAEVEATEPRYENFVRTIAVDVTADPRDEIGQALAARGPLLFSRERPVNPALAALEPPREFLVAAIRLRDKVLGIVVADDPYGAAPIDPQAREFIGFLLDTAALASENLRLHESVETLARHDELTGLFNRREFESRMADEQSRAQRLGSQCALLLFDVDYLQRVNLARGHKAGDELLQSVGVLLRSTLRSHDIVARLTGDAFAVLVTDTNHEQVLAIARRVGSLALGMGVSLSAGGSLWPRDNHEMSVLFSEAEAALIDAKRGGRGRAVIDGDEAPMLFTPPGDDDALD
ncbi:diguanylate cyclase (GGDEF) domain-containing protein [Nannocystis exedens]|uniref:diguanylate cyclase n=1 Tax=Nannocystis exedens TaxID=54 RepID=A0A1I2DM19_9BACT|nr:GGDEF domain-containing protein [Nannocystis exedens]PCC69061.1 putative diguanylate cyclase YegE [Nannocystis exedens]SFE81517.1 diguanylate cyclase (GGDEF) domain-containing protein [Nannocystis exedens]